MTDDELIVAYIADMKFRNLLPGTIAVRKRYLAKFSRDVGFADATEQRIIGWLGERDITPKTRSMWVSTLSSFYKWALKGDNGEPCFPRTAKDTDFNPAADVPKTRLHPRHPRPIPDADLDKALANATPLMKCWLLLEALAGMRCQEVAGLSREDIVEATNTIHIVHGKGDRPRWVPLHPDILEALRALPMRDDEGPLWNETPASVSRTINTYLHSLQIRSTAHTLRHWFATNTYRDSRDIILTQNLMGHADMATTAIYAAADQSKSAGVVFGLRIGGHR